MVSSKLDTIEWYKMCLVVYYINESYLKNLLKNIHTYSWNTNRWEFRTSVVLGISMQPMENENQWKHLYLMFWEIMVLITTSYNNEKLFFHIDKPHSYFMTLLDIFWTLNNNMPHIQTWVASMRNLGMHIPTLNLK